MFYEIVYIQIQKWLFGSKKVRYPNGASSIERSAYCPLYGTTLSGLSRKGGTIEGTFLRLFIDFDSVIQLTPYRILSCCA